MCVCVCVCVCVAKRATFRMRKYQIIYKVTIIFIIFLVFFGHVKDVEFLLLQNAEIFSN